MDENNIPAIDGAALIPDCSFPSKRSRQLLLVDHEDLVSLIKNTIKEVFEELVRKQETEVKKRKYSRQEVADILHVTLPTIDAMVKRGQIKCEKVGRRVLFNAEDIDNAVAGNKLYRYQRVYKTPDL